jgi:hypothetical protein
MFALNSIELSYTDFNWFHSFCANHLQLMRVCCRVDSASEDSTIYYGDHGIGASNESRRFGLPNIRVNDKPD